MGGLGPVLVQYMRTWREALLKGSRGVYSHLGAVCMNFLLMTCLIYLLPVTIPVTITSYQLPVNS